MTEFILRRIMLMIPTLILIAFLVYFVSQLPPGDMLSSYYAELAARGETVSYDALENLRERYGLDQPFFVQFWKWAKNIVLKGDFGQSFNLGRPVSEIIWNRLAWSLSLSLFALVISLLGIVIGIYSATHQYSIGDYVATFFGFLGLSIPNFFLALFLMFIMVFYFGATSVGGLFSPEYRLAPWSLAKFVDLLKHVWIPLVVMGTAGTAGNIRIMRANMLDILGRDFMRTARGKGLKERVVIYKHALRNALQPIVMSLGLALPFMIQGELITAMVIGVPTLGPLFLEAILTQDVHMVAGVLLLIGILLVISNLLADLALVWLDPRIRY